MTTASYWLAEPHDPLPSARLDGAPDVAVVGGGITGCSCALALAEAGLRVRLYEAREVAGGASGRNGGFALRGGSAPYPVLADSIGSERTAALWRWTEAELVELAAVAGDAYRPTGSLRLAVDEEEREELRVEYDALRAGGFAAEWRDELPTPLDGRYPGAIFHPRTASSSRHGSSDASPRVRQKPESRSTSTRESGRAGDGSRHGRRRDRRLSERSSW